MSSSPHTKTAAAADKKKLLLISGFHPDPAAARYSLPSARAFAVHKDPVLFVIPISSASAPASSSLKKQVNATLIALHPLRDVICVNTPSAASSDGPGFVQVFDLLTKARVAKVPVKAPPVLLRWLSPRCAAFISSNDSGTSALETITLPPHFAPPNALAGDVSDIVRKSEPLFSLFEDLLDLEFCLPCRIDSDIDPLFAPAQGASVLPRWLLLVTRCANDADARDPEASNDLVHQLHSIDKDASQLVSGQHARLHRRAFDGRLFLYLVTLGEEGLMLSVLAIRENENEEQVGPDMLQFSLDLPRSAVVIDIVPMPTPRTLVIFTHAGDVLVIATTTDGSQPKQSRVSLFTPESRPLAVVPALNSDSQLIVLEASGAIMRLNIHLDGYIGKNIGGGLIVTAASTSSSSPHESRFPQSAPAQTTSFDKRGLPGYPQSPLSPQTAQPQPRPRSNSLQPRSGSGANDTGAVDSVLLEHLRAGDYTSAALLCATTPIADIGAVRRALVKSYSSSPSSPNASSGNHQVDSRIAAFLNALLPLRQLSQSESVAFAQSSFAAIAALGSGGRDSLNYAHAVPAAVAARRLTPSEALADALLRGHSQALKSDWAAAAADVFLEIGMPERSISTLIVLDKCRELVAFLKRSLHAAPTDPNVLTRLLAAPATAPAELAVLMLSSMTRASDSSGAANAGSMRAIHARTLLDVLLRNPDIANVIHYLDSILEDTPEYGAMQTIFLQMLNRTDPSRFCVAADKYSHYDRRLFGMSSNKKQGSGSPSDSSNVSLGNRVLAEASSSTSSPVPFNFANALSTYTSAQWLEKLLHFLRESHTSSAADDHSTQPLFDAEIVTKLTPALISEHLVDGDESCGIARLLAAVIDIERPSLTRRVAHRILENSIQGARSENSLREITLLYASASLLCCSNTNVEAELARDSYILKYPAHVALAARNLGFFEFAHDVLKHAQQQKEQQPKHAPSSTAALARIILVADDMGDLARAIKMANEIEDPAVWRAVLSRVTAALDSDILAPSGRELAGALYSASPASRIPGSFCISFARG